MADAKDLNYTVVENLFAFVGFPSSYINLASLPKNLEYTVQSQELAKSTYNVFANFYEKSNFLYSDSPQSYCNSNSTILPAFIWGYFYLFVIFIFKDNQYFSLYKTIFNPIKHAIDLTLINFITASNLTNPSQVSLFIHISSYQIGWFINRYKIGKNVAILLYIVR